VRTTLSLDDDVAAKLDAEVRRSGRSFKAVVNDALRAGLLRRGEKTSSPPFVVRAKALGLRPGLSYDNIEELLDAVEGPLRR
jgi:plasmid stability protein